MASDAQIRANRRNAQQSTGPRTPEGKDQSRFNATKHGLSARLVVLPWEDVGDYFELHGALLRQYQPENPTEMFLVDQVAQNWWRLNRSRRFESGMLAKLEPGSDPATAPRPEDLDTHRRYEAGIERAFYRAYDRIEKIVRRRPKPQPEAEPEPAQIPEPEDSEALTSTGFVSQNAVNNHADEAATAKRGNATAPEQSHLQKLPPQDCTDLTNTHSHLLTMDRPTC